MNSHPVAVRLFAGAARIVLPRGFAREFAGELRDSFADQYRMARRRNSAAVAAFVLHELAGLLATAGREHREVIFGPHTRRRRVRLPAPRRNREVINTLRQDLIYSIRMIVKTPVVTGIAVLSLAIAVAANTSIFSVLNSWLLRPLPYPDAERLVMVWENDRNDSDDSEGATVANYFDWREQSNSFEALIAAEFSSANLTGMERPEQLRVSHVTPDFLRVLAAEPLIGRTFREDEGGPEDTPVAVIGESLWRDRFAGDNAVLNQTMMLDGRAYTIVGVMPETFDFLVGSVKIWVADTFESRRTDRTVHTLVVTGRLRGGVTPAQAQNEMTSIASRLEEQYPETNEGWGVNVETLKEQFPGDTDRGLVQILMTVVFLVLLIACVNIANLLLAKTDSRQKEIAVRMALGAGKGRIVRQLLTEAVVLALIAGSLGTVLSIWGVAFLAQVFPPEVPVSFVPTLDTTVVAFSLALSVFAGLTFGIAPAAQAVGGGMRGPLIDGVRGGSASRKKRRIRDMFVMVEFAMALTILIGAGVLADLFQRSLSVDLGFDADNLLTMQVALPKHKYDEDDAIRSFVTQLERELGGLPGTPAYAIMNVLPRTRRLPSTDFTIDGRQVEPGEEPSTSWLSVNSDYFTTMEIALQRGRQFTEADREGTSPVVLVNQRMVDLFFDGNDPVGQRVTIFDESREIVGVVSDIAQRRLTGLQAFDAATYFPMAQRPLRGMWIALRATGDPYSLAGPAQTAVWNVDPDQPINAIQTMHEHMTTTLAGPNLLTQILFVVGSLALSLAAIGIYGVMAYAVSQQTKEIGIRMALGAKPAQVLMKVTRQGATLAGFGLLLGIPTAALAVRFISRMFQFGDISGTGGITAAPMVSVSAMLVSVALVACVIPARRATKIEPVVALQQE